MPELTRRFERVAHRGASKERLENTMPAFLLALERGADAIELDVHLTRDGVVVVHHDEDIAGRAIAASDWSVLSRMRLADDARIPRLDDVLIVVGDRAVVYIEIKGRGVEGPALDVARRHGKRFAVHAFDHAAVERAVQLAPEVSRGVLLDKGLADPVGAMTDAIQRVRPRDVWPHFSLVDEPFVQAAARLAVRVIVWTVNAEDEASRLIGLGVAGICTDDVRILANL